MEKRHRIFIAINLPGEVKRELSKYREKLPDLPAKWSDQNCLHITLEFLGELKDQELADVCKVVGEVAKRHNIFSLELNKIAYGPNGKMPPKMVWASGEKSEDLADLRKDLQECLLQEVRYRPEGRGFTPHITLARIKEWEWKQIEPDERPEVNEGINLALTVESIEVMESELKRTGPVYTILESHQLKQ